MPWRVGIVAALLVWLLLAGPAGAAIQHSTDSRGVIHISNIPAAKAPPSQPDSPAEAFEPEAALNLPQPPAPAALGVRQRQDKKAAAAQPVLKVLTRVCQDAVSGGSAPLAAALTAALSEAEETPDKLPLQPVAYEPPAAAPQALPLRAAAPKRAEMVTAGGIRRYQDAQGVWHITNVAPAAEGAGPGLLLADNPRPPEAASPKEAQERLAAVESRPALKKVSWSPDNPFLETLPATVAAARTAAPGAANLIRRWRDSKGVIHIDNVGEEPPDAKPPPTLHARAGPAPGRRSPPLVEDWAAAPLKPVAWSDDRDLNLLHPVKASASRKAEMTTEGGIRRWRDKKGVWHIETPEYPRPDVGPRAPQLAVQHPGNQVAAAPGPMAAVPGTAAARPAPAATSGALTTITALRDRQGRLKITNKQLPPPGIGPPPPMAGATAPAVLEPLIAEAAQAHRLPATLVRAVIKTESNFCSWAVSPKGAMGLMQLMPGTASFLGVQEPLEPRQNLHGGCRYLRLLIDLFGGNVPLALAAYNAGYQRVINSGYQVPPIKETQDFVTQVMGRYVAEEKKGCQPWT